MQSNKIQLTRTQIREWTQAKNDGLTYKGLPFMGFKGSPTVRAAESYGESEEQRHQRESRAEQRFERREIAARIKAECPETPDREAKRLARQAAKFSGMVSYLTKWTLEKARSRPEWFGDCERLLSQSPECPKEWDELNRARFEATRSILVGDPIVVRALQNRFDSAEKRSEGRWA
jgi:hypothetical protein